MYGTPAEVGAGTVRRRAQGWEKSPAGDSRTGGGMPRQGDVVTLSGSDRELRLRRFIGEGSQGAVWEAHAENGDRLAVKIYFPNTASATQRELISELVERGAPDRRFLWPLDLVDTGRPDDLAYAMPLRPEGYVGLADLLTGRIDAPFSIACRVSLELADAFLALHSQGLCYRDISFGNVFFDPTTGMPLICDNDNVGIDGRSRAAVLGTRRFMAPEIVRREAIPSVYTDLYSLAVVLFYLLFMGHPLIGRRELDFPCWDEAAESKLFGVEPRFVFDPEDESNAPLPDFHDAIIRHWEIYPAFLRETFVQAFTTGLTDPVNGRVRESVWRATLARLHDGIIRCETCNREGFAVPGEPVDACWSCQTRPRTTLWLQVGRSSVAVRAGARITGHHLHHDYDYERTVAIVEPHPTRVGLLGLRNQTTTEWTADLGSEQVAVPPGQRVRLEPGVSVRIDGGVIRVVAHEVG